LGYLLKTFENPDPDRNPDAFGDSLVHVLKDFGEAANALIATRLYGSEQWRFASLGNKYRLNL
jgi:hypothetical protein